MKINRILFFSLAVSFLAFTTACDNEEDTNPLANKTLYGKSVAMGDGTGRTWATFDVNGKPLEVGVSISEEAVKSLPQDDHSNYEGHIIYYEMELPAELKQHTPFNHVVVDWNPMGHPPEIYQVPHFDAHFYMITSEERKKIGPDNLDPKIKEIPDAKYLPADYIDINVNVPEMGKHWLDKFTPEFNGHLFNQTFIYGSYAGKVSFYEPMFTLEYLQTLPNDTYTLKQPADFLKRGLYYPTKYSIRYNKEKKEYNISIGEMELK